VPVFFQDRNSALLTLFKVSTVPIPVDAADIGPGPDNIWIGDDTHIKVRADHVVMING